MITFSNEFCSWWCGDEVCSWSSSSSLPSSRSGGAGVDERDTPGVDGAENVSFV